MAILKNDQIIKLTDNEVRESEKWSGTKMGQTGTKVASKLVNSFSFSAADEKEIEIEDGTVVKFRGNTPLVYNRRG